MIHQHLPEQDETAAPIIFCHQQPKLCYNQSSERGGLVKNFVWIFALLAVLAVALLLLLPRTAGRFAPPYPLDTFHALVLSDAGCLTCHTPGRQSPLSDRHPPDMHCLTCHQPRSAR